MSEIENKERILEAIDQMRRRKSRPDVDRICNFVLRRFGVEPKDTIADLQRLVEADLVIKVDYKGNTSYRNAAKWSKYAMYKNRRLRNSCASAAIRDILSRAFASLLVGEPDFLDVGVPRAELERFMLQDDPLTDLAKIGLILTKATSSGFLVKLKNGNYSLADHPVPAGTGPGSAFLIDDCSIAVDATGTHQSSSVKAAGKPAKPETSSPHEEKKPELEAAPPPVTTPTPATTPMTTPPSPAASTSNMSKMPLTVAATSGSEAELGTINDSGFRVGVRRKMAKKVFDPSDNDTPTRKRGSVRNEDCSRGELLQCRDRSNWDSKRITGKFHHKKWNTSRMMKAIEAVHKKKMGWKKASRVFNIPKTTLMRWCHGKYGRPADGAERARPNCIVAEHGKEKPLLNQWFRHGYKLCAFCCETSENEAMAVCVACGDAYHLTCHNPPVTDQQWRSKWLCSSCDDVDKADTKPTHIKPVDLKPTVVKPVDSKRVDVKPIDINPADVKPVDMKRRVSKATPETEVTSTTAPGKMNSKRLIEEDPFFKRYVPKEETPDPTNWTADEVCKYLQEHGCAAQAEAFRHHEIDGRSLLLLTRHDVLYELGLKLGPALKVNHFVQLLQKKDIRKVFPFNEMLF